MDFLRDPPDVLRSFPPSSTPQQSSTTHVQLPPGVDSESRVAANGFGVTLRHVVDVQTASSVRRLPGLASSGLMLEVVNGTLDEFTDAGSCVEITHRDNNNKRERERERERLNTNTLTRPIRKKERDRERERERELL